MRKFIFVGKKKVFLNIPTAKFLLKKSSLKGRLSLDIEDKIKLFFRKNSQNFLNRKVAVVIPDKTRDFHPKIFLPLISKNLKKLTSNFFFIIALGLHKKLTKKELAQFLGKEFLRKNKVLQHCLEDTVFLKNIRKIPLSINRNILDSEVVITLGVVEPHLYAGFSGGVKCLGIGLAGRETILYTHSLNFLKKRGVSLANLDNNPFQQFLWKVPQILGKKVYSLNIVNNLNKEIIFSSFSESKNSFKKAVNFAKKFYSYPVKEKFDLLFVGTDFPKEKSFYQVSRLFNYILDKKNLLNEKGVIFIFSDLKKVKSKAEENFEKLLKEDNIPSNYPFRKPGEHRAYKVRQALKKAYLGLINPKGYDKFSKILFFRNYKEALSWAKKNIKEDLKIGIIPAGFSFLSY